MAEIIIFISVSSVLLLISLADVEIDFIYRDAFTIEINFIFLTLILSFDKNEKRKKRKRNSFISPSTTKKTIKSLLRHSDVKVDRILIFAPDNPPHIFSVRYRNALTLFSVIFSLLSLRVRSFSAPPDAVGFISHDGPIKVQDAHATVCTKFYILIYSLLILLISGIRQKIKRYRTERYDV